MTKEQYISNWHDNFVNYIKNMLALADWLIMLPQATDRKTIKEVYIVEKKDAKNDGKQYLD